jgi:MFS family permease
MSRVLSGPLATTRRVFASLTGRNYRLWFAGQLVSLSGTWMQQVAQDWLVLSLTNRALPVGIVTALQFGPVALFGFWGGLTADRFDKRTILIATQATQAALALALGLLTAFGVVELWMVYVLATLLGIVTAFDMPARQAFVMEMVGPDQVTNAVALNSALFNTARIIGPATAGVAIVAFGIAPAFLINAGSYIAVLVALVAMDSKGLHRTVAADRKGKGQVREGLRYVWRTPVLRTTVAMVAVAGTLGLNYRVVLPLLARFVFQGGPGTLGLMTSVMAVGSVAGALYVAGRGRPTRTVLVVSVGLLGVSSLLAGIAPTLGLELATLVLIGLTTITFLATANATLQLTSSPEMRGRVLALHGVVFLGTTPIGGLLSGWLAEHYGARVPMWLSGVTCLAVAVVALPGMLRARRAAPVAGAEAKPEVAEPATAELGMPEPARPAGAGGVSWGRLRVPGRRLAAAWRRR